MSSVIAAAAGSTTVAVISELLQLLLTPGGQAIADRFLVANGVTASEIAKLRADTNSIPDPPDGKE